MNENQETFTYFGRRISVNVIHNHIHEVNQQFGAYSVMNSAKISLCDSQSVDFSSAAGQLFPFVQVTHS